MILLRKNGLARIDHDVYAAELQIKALVRFRLTFAVLVEHDEQYVLDFLVLDVIGEARYEGRPVFDEYHLLRLEPLTRNIVRELDVLDFDLFG